MVHRGLRSKDSRTLRETHENTPFDGALFDRFASFLRRLPLADLRRWLGRLRRLLDELEARVQRVEEELSAQSRDMSLGEEHPWRRQRGP